MRDSRAVEVYVPFSQTSPYYKNRVPQVITEVYQYDYGLILVIRGFETDVLSGIMIEDRKFKDTKLREPTWYEDYKVYHLNIPNYILQTAGDKHFYLFVEYEGEDTSVIPYGYTVADVVVHVEERQKPASPETYSPSYFEDSGIYSYITTEAAAKTAAIGGMEAKKDTAITSADVYDLRIVGM